jgi:uncharacterized membrane protein
MGDVAQGAPVRLARDLAVRDLGAALAAGWRDFCAAPRFGLFFAGVYVAAGWFLWFELVRRGHVAWLVPAAGGFPLVAPFVAVGLYEVSRRREAGLPVGWRDVLGAVRGRGDDQVLMLGGFLFVGVTFWIILAHGIFAVFLAQSGIGTESLALFATPSGLAMLVVGGAVGAAMALAFYAVSVISLPLLIDREVDFLTAMIASMATVRDNRRVMLVWAALLGAGLTLAMVPAFLGLLVALPVFAHATWHLYRRVVGEEG